MFPSSRHHPRSFGEWFDQNVKYIFVVLTAIGAAALVMIAVNSAPHPPANAVAGPIPTFGTTHDVPTRAVFIGDSYTAGAGASNSDHRFTTLIANQEHWVEANFGRGGTGYTSGVKAPTAKLACGLDYCPSFTEMIPDAAASHPDIVFVSGGRNQSGADPDSLATGITDFYKQLRAALPDATIYAMSPVWDSRTPPEDMAEMIHDVQSAAQAVNATFLNVGEPLANHPEQIAPDHVHPTDGGHALLAEAAEAALG